MRTIKVYGADWCASTKRTIEHLRQLGERYQFIDIDEDPEAAAWVRRHNHGKEVKPTVDIGGKVLSEPDNEQLDQALARG